MKKLFILFLMLGLAVSFTAPHVEDRKSAVRWTAKHPKAGLKSYEYVKKHKPELAAQ